jgi:F1F0 ATPase subunit 2
LNILIAFIVGLGLGLFNCICLWVTVKNIPFVKKPMLLTMASYYLRMGTMLAGFFLVMQEKWENLVVCLAGFLMMRFIFIKLFQPKRGLRESPREG